MANKTARNKAKLKAKQRKRAARRYGLIKVRKPGQRMKGRVGQPDRARR